MIIHSNLKVVVSLVFNPEYYTRKELPFPRV